MVPMQVDIVGGSIAGLSTAISLKEHDPSIDVVVHEKYKDIGYNHEGRRCGEAHTVEREWIKWKLEKRSIYNEIAKGEVVIGKHQYVLPTKPGTSFILNRQEFICQLARQAEKLSVDIHTNDKITSPDDLDGAYIVDASGCPSTLKQQLGINQGMTGSSYQQTLTDSNWFVADTARLFFTEFFGYFWVFPRNPKKKEVNVGIGVFGNVNYSMKKLVEDFIQDHEIDGAVSYVSGGPVPTGLQYPLRWKNILFVGDAGVGTFPLTGQGIYRALMSGDIAGGCIASGHAEQYTHRIYQAFLKWEIIGKSFLRMVFVFRKIGPAPVLRSSDFLVKYWNMSH